MTTALHAIAASSGLLLSMAACTTSTDEDAVSDENAVHANPCGNGVRDVGEVFVSHFDTALASWVGVPPSLCIFQQTCGDAVALEHNGDVYSCDHFVEPTHLLVVSRDALMKLMRKDSMLSVKLLWAFSLVLSERLRQTNETVILLRSELDRIRASSAHSMHTDQPTLRPPFGGQW